MPTGNYCRGYAKGGLGGGGLGQHISEDLVAQEKLGIGIGKEPQEGWRDISSAPAPLSLSPDIPVTLVFLGRINTGWKQDNGVR